MTKSSYIKNTFSLILKFVKFFTAILAFAIVLMLSIPVGFYGMYLYIEPELPTIEEIKAPVYKMPLQIYTKDKYLIAEFGDEISLPVTYEQIPKTFIDAFLAAEDDTFFEHEGISIKGLGRAVTEIISDSDRQTGGSTITMQVAKNYFLSSDKTFKRKLTELFLARRIEQNFTKKEILTLYVNKIYLGANAYGINAAAKKYYSKTLDHLTIAQMAMLAGLPKAPSQNNPLSNPEKAMIRRNWILNRMLKLKKITPDQHQHAIQEELDLHLYKTKVDKSIPYVAEWARYSLVKEYGKSVMNSGWRVQLTIDSKRQEMAENALKKGLIAYGRRHGWHGVDKNLHDKKIRYFKEFDGNWPAKITKVNVKTIKAVLNTGEDITIHWSGARKYINPNRVGYFSSDARKVFKKNDIIHVRLINEQKKTYRVSLLPKVQGALAAVNPNNGAVEAMAGGFDFHYSKFNRATQGWRQPGSIIKPLVYTLALEKGYRPDSMVSDDKLRVGSWKPKNSDGRYYGRIPLRKALYLSRNLVSIRLLQSVGITEARQFLSLFGLTKDKLPSNLTLALGTGQVLPIQMATAYATFANGGHRIQPHFIKSIYQFDGSLVYFANPSQSCASCYNKSIGIKVNKNAKDNKKPLDIKKEKAKANQEKSPKKDANKQNKVSEKKEALYTNNAVAENDKLTKFTTIKLAASQAPRIISPRVAYDMASILKDVVIRGTGKRAQSTGRSDIGGKTGTTNMARDAWFAGFQPDLAAVVWVGYDTPRPLGRREYGGVAALPIWARFMRQALSNTPTRWVTSENISKSDKQTNKVIKITNEEDEQKKDTDLTYQSDFVLPPTAYYIRRKTRKTVRKETPSIAKESNSESLDSPIFSEVYIPQEEFKFKTYNGNNKLKNSNNPSNNLPEFVPNQTSKPISQDNKKQNDSIADIVNNPKVEETSPEPRNTMKPNNNPIEEPKPDNKPQSPNKNTELNKKLEEPVTKKTTQPIEHKFEDYKPKKDDGFKSLEESDTF